jgi:hypothetical protein
VLGQEGDDFGLLAIHDMLHAEPVTLLQALAGVHNQQQHLKQQQQQVYICVLILLL